MPCRGLRERKLRSMLGANVALLSKRERHAVAELLQEHAYLFNNWPPPGANPCLRQGYPQGRNACDCLCQTSDGFGGEKPVQKAVLGQCLHTPVCIPGVKSTNSLLSVSLESVLLQSVLRGTDASAGIRDEQKRALVARATAHSDGIGAAVESERLAVLQVRLCAEQTFLSLWGLA